MSLSGFPENWPFGHSNNGVILHTLQQQLNDKDNDVAYNASNAVVIAIGTIKVCNSFVESSLCMQMNINW